MKNFKLFIVLLFLASVVSAQITDTATQRNFINSNIVPNSTRAITATQLNLILNGYLNIDKNYKTRAVDTVYTVNDSTIAYKINGVAYNLSIKGGSRVVGDFATNASLVNGLATKQNSLGFTPYNINNPSGYISSESVFAASPASSIRTIDIINWNGNTATIGVNAVNLAKKMDSVKVKAYVDSSLYDNAYVPYSQYLYTTTGQTTYTLDYVSIAPKSLFMNDHHLNPYSDYSITGQTLTILQPLMNAEYRIDIQYYKKP